MKRYQVQFLISVSAAEDCLTVCGSNEQQEEVI